MSITLDSFNANVKPAKPVKAKAYGSQWQKVVTGVPQNGTAEWHHDDDTIRNAGTAPRSTVPVALDSDDAHMWRTYTTLTESQLPRANRHNTDAEITVRRTVTSPTASHVYTPATMKRSRRNGKCTTHKLLPQ